MIASLEKYLPREAGGGQWLPAQIERRRRLVWLLAVSFIGHAVFFISLFKMNEWWLENEVAKRRARGSSSGLVRIADLAPSHDKLPSMRRPPEALERASITDLQLDDTKSDDQSLITRTPRPSTLRGYGGSGSNANHTQPDRPAGGEAKMRVNPTDVHLAPKQPGAVDLRSPQPAGQQAASPTKTPPAAPPSSSEKQSTRGDENLARIPISPTPGGSPGELGLRRAQSQYIAYVRAKIWRVNERIMPRRWIEGMLADKVSADFSVLLMRGGLVSSARLVRSSGFSTLDDIARQAILTASPFEGWPQEAGDSLALTVTVYYTPHR